MNRPDRVDASPDVAGLSPAKRELLRRMEQRASSRAGLTIRRRPPGRRAPLSFAQQRLWFLDQLEPGSSTYNVPRALRLDGALDADALRRALEEIVDRHESLRTVFRSEAGELWQAVEGSRSVPLPLTDLSELPEGAAEARAMVLAEEEAERPFDLSQGPLLRASLLRLGSRSHILLLSLHHIVSDAWSTGVLFGELAALYEAFSNGRPSPLPDLPVQYADFALWQRDWLQGEVLEELLRYWRGRLEGAGAPLELPTDLPRPARQTFRGAVRSRLLPRDLRDALERLGQAESATLFMTMLTAFQTLLLRYTDQEDIVVGSPIANRSRSEIEGSIGFFTNTLVLRSDLSGDPTFREALQRVREVALGAYAHQDLPFEKLVEDLRPDRDLGRNPLFQVMVSLQNVVQQTRSLAGLTLTPLEVERTSAKFELSLFLGERPEGLICVLEYNTDLFLPSSVERMLGHFQTLLEAVVENPDRPLSRLPILSPSERLEVVAAGRGPERAFPVGRCLPDLFEVQVERGPDAAAILCGDTSWTYRELDERANRVARMLIASGVGVETPVGLCVERSEDMYAGLLGILKAGGAYVPLDPSYPAASLTGMLEDSKAPVLLTQRSLREKVPSGATRVLTLDDASGFPAEGVGALRGTIRPDNAAYVIYTSGSTGRPKGVAGSHRSSLNRFAWMWEAHPFAAGERCCQKTALSFVDSIWEIFGPLLKGIPTVVIPDATVRDPRELARSLSGHGVTRIVLVPSLLRAILDLPADSTGGLQGLKLWVSSGEALPEELLARFRSSFPNAILLNLYGSSEVAADATAYDASGSDAVDRFVPIGRAIANTQVVVVDRQGEPVPFGVPGDIRLGGANLARGYHARPDRTAERFVPDPFAPEPGQRLYVTGDLGRMREDGNVTYLGRRDHQVKVRGHRVEPGPVEALLSSHPGVRECAVVARKDATEGNRLIAYVSAAGAAAPEPEELRAFLKERLPEFMIPSLFVRIEALPRKPNGKLDRSALPDPTGTDVLRETSYVAPRTAVEEQLASLWSEVLEVERIGTRADFFALGGHSLLGAQLLSRVRSVFGVDLPMRALFESPTLAGLAERIGRARGAGRRAEDPPFRPVDRAGKVPLSAAQKRMWFLDQLDPGNPAYNIRRAHRLVGPLDAEMLRRALDAVVARHEVLRARFTSEDGSAAQVIDPPGPVSLPIANLTGVGESEKAAEVRRRMAEEGERGFRLAQEPPFRVSLLRLAPAEYVLLMTLHHIAGDAWSMAVFYRELSAYYEAFAAGRSPSLPDLPIQYADFATWQAERVRGELLEDQLAYWRGQLTGAPPLLALPSDRPRPARRSFQGGRWSLSFPTALARQLTALSRKEGVTLYMTLLASYAVLLSASGGGEDLVIGSPTAGRQRLETEGLIGLFVQTLAMRADLSGNPTFREVLARTRQTVLGAFENQDVPFERIVDDLQPERSLSHNPIFQAWFVLQMAAPQSLRLPGITVAPIEMDSSRVRHDLQLSLWPSPGGLAGSIEYSRDLFDPGTIARMADRFGRLLGAVVADPDAPLASLRRILDASERESPTEPEQELAQASLRKLKGAKRKAVSE